MINTLLFIYAASVVLGIIFATLHARQMCRYHFSDLVLDGIMALTPIVNTAAVLFTVWSLLRTLAGVSSFLWGRK